MSHGFVSRLATALFVGAVALAVAGGGIAPAMAQGQGQAKSAANTQRDKKPGQSCDGMDKKTKAYSDCVKAQAQSDKKPKKPDEATDLQADKKAAKAVDQGKAKKVN